MPQRTVRKSQKLTAEQIENGKRITARLNGMDVGEGTRLSYSRKIGHFKSWCEANCEAALLEEEEVKKLQENAKNNGEHDDYLIVYNFNTVFLEESYYGCIHDYLTTYINPNTGMLFGWGTYNGIKCALKKIWEWRPKSDVVTRGICPRSFNSALDKTIRKIQSLNESDQKVGIRNDVDMAQEGITFNQYQELCDYFIKKNQIDCWFFLVMEFNLMCRINQVRDLTTTRIIWHGDALAIQFSKMKVTKKGAFKFNKHIYANSFDPTVCPITAMGCYLLIHGPTMDASRMFSKYDDSRFLKQLKHAAKECNIPVNLTGSHALRKSSWSHSQNGTTCSPSYAATCLRADHSLGNVKDRYNCGGAAQDQYLGRILAGLDPNLVGFAVLPPHFHSSFKSRELVRELYPAWKNWGESFEPVIAKCLASVVFHYDYFKKSNCTRLHSTGLFTNEDFQKRLSAQLVSEKPVYESKYIKATGIPPHTSLLIQLEKINPDLKQMLTEVLDERDMGTSQVNRLYFDKTIDALNKQNIRLEKKIDALRNVGNTNTANHTTMLTNDFLRKTKQRRTPASFELNQGKTVYEAWISWIVGVKTQNVPPLYKLEGSDFHSRSSQIYFSHVNKVCSTLLNRTVSAEMEQLKRLSADPDKANSNAHTSFHELCSKFPTKKSSIDIGKMSCRTMVDHINKHRKQVASQGNGRKKRKRKKRKKQKQRTV
jgi:hypothetical protein